jgi:hypothetical protein
VAALDGKEDSGFGFRADGLPETYSRRVTGEEAKKNRERAMGCVGKVI